MKNKDIKTSLLPNLNESVMKALTFFNENKPKSLKTSSFKFPLIVGSGNAYNAGKIMFGNHASIFANESDFKTIVKNYKILINKKIIKEAIIISASGEKDSVWEVRLAKSLKLKTTLITCSANSSASKLADKTIVFNKLPEPYTYNVSTYLGMIIASSGESAKQIEDFIKKIKLPKNFHKHSAFSFILPDEFSAIAPMLEIKRHELFGPHLSLRAFSFGEARHAKFVIPWEKEMVISFGKNKYFGLKDHRFEVKLPKKYGAGLIMALSYYIIGLIQKEKPSFYKKNIANYCKEGLKAYGKKGEFSIIVE